MAEKISQRTVVAPTQAEAAQYLKDNPYDAGKSYSDVKGETFAKVFGGVGLGLQISGTLLDVLSSYYSSKNTQRVLKFEAFMADQNAKMQELAAKQELVKGQKAEQQVELATAQLKSRQKVGYAAAGVELGEGSALDVLTTTDIMGEIDANTIAENAIRAAWGYRTQAQAYESEAEMKRATEKGISPSTQIATSLLGGAGNVASSWYGLNKVGVV